MKKVFYDYLSMKKKSDDFYILFFSIYDFLIYDLIHSLGLGLDFKISDFRVFWIRVWISIFLDFRVWIRVSILDFLNSNSNLKIRKIRNPNPNPNPKIRNFKIQIQKSEILKSKPNPKTRFFSGSDP